VSSYYTRHVADKWHGACAAHWADWPHPVGVRGGTWNCGTAVRQVIYLTQMHGRSAPDRHDTEICEFQSLIYSLRRTLWNSTVARLIYVTVAMFSFEVAICFASTACGVVCGFNVFSAKLCNLGLFKPFEHYRYATIYLCSFTVLQALTFVMISGTLYVVLSESVNKRRSTADDDRPWASLRR